MALGGLGEMVDPWLCASLVGLGWKPNSASSWLAEVPQSQLWMKSEQDEVFASPELSGLFHQVRPAYNP